VVSSIPPLARMAVSPFLDGPAKTPTPHGQP
jgi:hypothetical protein